MKRFFTTAVIVLPLFVSAQKQEVLKQDQLKTIQLEKGTTKTFAIKLQLGTPYVIHLEQKGIDVALVLRDSTGKELAQMDSPNGLYGPERIELTPMVHSNLIVSIEPLSDPANTSSGKCSIRYRVRVPDDERKNRLLSPKEMKKDLLAFRSIREKANSGLYRYRTVQQIDSIYSWAFSATKKAMPITDFHKIILVLTDFEGSNHNGTRLPFKGNMMFDRTRGYFPFFMKWVDGKMLVNYQGGEIPLGSQVVSVNGIPDAELRKRFYKYFTTDGYNLTAKERLAAEDAFGWLFPFEMGTLDVLEIGYKLPGSDRIETIRMKTVSADENSRRYFNRYSAPADSLLNYEFQPKYSFVRINDSTARLNFRIFTMASNAEDPEFAVFSHYLDSIFTFIKQENITHLILDVRNNPGGNDPNYEKVFTYLTDRSFYENKGAYILFSKIPYPEYIKKESEDKENQKRMVKSQDDYLKSVFTVKQGNYYLQHPDFNPVYHPDSNRFEGKLYLVINEHVGSAASHFASLVRGYSNATVVGIETSGGYYGHNGHYPIEYTLPNSGITTRFSIVHVDQDAPLRKDQPVGHGIRPDYTVPLSFGDFMNQEDSQVKFVLKLIEGMNKH